MHTSFQAGVCLVTLALFSGTNAVLAAPRVPASQETVRISVLSLFHPKQLRLWAAENSAMELDMGDRDGHLSGSAKAVIASQDNRIQVRVGLENEWIPAKVLRTKSRDGAVDFWLEVPGKIRRRYRGGLEIHSDGHTLEAVVTMPLETAVGSIVDAESPPQAPLEAMKAQAVATRSFLVARQTGHRAAGFDFCDTTHCQFLRSPPAADRLAAAAARATAGLILTFRDVSEAQERPLPAMYARSCGGRTRALREIGVRSVNGYPYYAVICEYCTRHPEIAKPSLERRHLATEGERLAWNRIHGWGSVPSLTGRGTGHGVGLCQLGAAAMARHGASFTEILRHYYPNTMLTRRGISGEPPFPLH